MSIRTTTASVVIAGLLLAACSSATGAADTTSGSDATVAGSTSDSTTSTAAVAEAASGTVSANDASEGEIAAALDAAGVDQADRWAREVVEYRPYDTADPDLTHLRDELAKYDPAPGVVDAIVAVLQP